MYVSSLVVGAIPHNSKIFYVTVKQLEILPNYSLFLNANITYLLQYDAITEESVITVIFVTFF